MSYLKSTPWNLFKCKVSCKTKNLNLGSKMPYSGYFSAGIWRNYCHIWRQQWFATFRTIKNFTHHNIKKIHTKNYLFVISVFLDWNFEKLLPYLKSAPSNFWKYKVSCKNKNAFISLHKKWSFPLSISSVFLHICWRNS